MLIYVFLAAAVVLALLWWGSSTFGSLRGIPGPQPLPFVGNLLYMLGMPHNEAQAALMRQYGGVARAFMGARAIVLVSDPTIVHEVTITAAEKFRNRPQAQRVRKTLGLLQARDDYWKRLRRTISPTFNVMHLKNMLAPMHEEIKVLMSKLEEACDAKQEIDIHTMFTRLTLDIIGRIAFGTKLNAQTNDDNEFLKVVGWIFRDVPRNNGALAMVFPRLWEVKQKLFPSELRAQVTKAQGVLDEVSLSLIRKRKRERDEENTQGHPAGEQELQRIPNDFLDLLFDARDKTTGQALTEEEIRDQANTFLLAGHETTANTLAYTVFLVAQHPEVDDKLFDELANLLVDETASLDLNQLSTMTRLNMALKESLRMYPPATSTAREADVDVMIGDKYFIPKGTTVVIPIKAMGNNPDLWSEPEKFLPFERWADDEKGEGDKKHSLVWLPFGAGPRNCIGQRFAIIEAKMILAHVLRRFRFHLSPGQVPLQFQPGITTSPKNGIKVTLQRR